MNSILSLDAIRFLDSISPEIDPILIEMEAMAKDRNFPTVGIQAGRIIQFLTRMSGAKKAFEFGSGFGYSAYWIAKGLPSDGSVILTDRDKNELNLARDFLNRAGVSEKAIFEVGDAKKIFDNNSDTFDLILFDHHNSDYLDDFHSVKKQLSPGGIIIADNAMSGMTVHFNDLVSFLDSEPNVSLNKNTRGTANYLLELKNDPLFETIVIPVGDGLVVSLSI